MQGKLIDELEFESFCLCEPHTMKGFSSPRIDRINHSQSVTKLKL